MRYLIIFLFTVTALVSCDEPIRLDLDQTQPKTVIEAQVTNKPGYQYVKVSRSVGFYESGKTPRITNAIVTVEDDLGHVFNFVHNPNAHPDSSGIYVPSPPFVGEVGRTYKLHVDIAGEIFTAEDMMHSIIPIDSIKYEIDEDEVEDPNEEGKVYELLLFAKEPQDEDNYYLFKFYRNDSLIFYNETDIYFTDDAFLGEEINGVPSPVYYGKNDLGRVEMYSLSRVGYVYFSDLWSLLNNDGGGMFGPIPSSPRTNLTNGAIGFFQVSAITEDEIKIE